MPISLPLGTSETFVVSSCGDVRGDPVASVSVTMLQMQVKTMRCRMSTDR